MGHIEDFKENPLLPNEQRMVMLCRLFLNPPQKSEELDENTGYSIV